jgi:amidohydrolase
LIKNDPFDNEIIELRRDLHVHPELSGHETRTSGIVAAELEKLGLKVIRAPEPATSVLGILECSRPGKTLALRADMDALPMKENPCNLMGPKAYVSQNDGAAHMCGHDFHTAGLLAAARRLTAMKDRLRGRVLFCFESGEEMGLGDDARALLAQQKPIDAVYGVHVQAAYPAGTAVVLDGPCTSGCEIFKVTVHGKSAHGALPHLALDPVNCAAQILCASNSIISRRINSREAAVISVCSIHGGTSWNRIPDECVLEGGLRFFSAETGRLLHKLVEQIVRGTAEACGCTAECQWRNWTLPVINDSALASLARSAAESAGVKLTSGEPWMASETYARYAEFAPTVFVFIGCANPEKGYGAPQHSDRFDADERCLAADAAVTVSFAEKFLTE